MAVFRLPDRVQVRYFDQNVQSALWDRNGHRLFLIGVSGLEAWTPEGGVARLEGTNPLFYKAGLAPDGGQFAYTAYADQEQRQMRVYLYDFKSATTRTLSDQSRSQVLFVKPGWVWYLEEGACDRSRAGCSQNWTAPTGKVYAMDLSTGVEQMVGFRAGDDPLTQAGPHNWEAFAPGEFWPAR